MFDLLRPFYFVRDLNSFFRFLQRGMAEVREGLVPDGTNVCFHCFLWSTPFTCLPICLRPGGRVAPPFEDICEIVVFVRGPLLKTFVPLGRGWW